MGETKINIPAGVVLTSLTITLLFACHQEAGAAKSTGKPAATQSAQAQSPEAMELAQLEQRLFFKTYDDEIAARLARIERRVFGEELQGGFQERMARVKEALGPQRNPDGSITGGGMPQQPPQAVQPPAQPSQPVPIREDPEAALQRAKLAVMAAKEEEVQRLMDEGVNLWRARRGNEATEKFEQVLRLDPRNAEAHFSMGIIYEAAGNFAEALASYRKAYDIQPANKDYKAAVAEIERKAQEKEKFQGQSGELKILAEDAAAAFKRKEYMTALDLYKQLDAKIPPTAHVKYNIGTLYLMISNPQSALEYYKAARKLKPQEEKYVEAVQQLEANLKQALGEKKKAEKAVSEAWNQQEKMFAAQQGGGKSKKPATLEPQPSKGQEAMNGYGIIGRTSREGVVITAIGIASKASKVGLLQGDVIRAVDGTVVKNTDELNEMLMKKMGQPVNLTVQRGNQLGQVAF
ncbi:MAG TPA: tetratricopeptide repeat protein [Candidatus Obscuribacterales bacterium]